MSGHSSRRWTDAAYWVLWGVAVALYLAWPLTHLNAYAWSNDEGLYVQAAALAHAGYPLYTVTSLNKPPLFIWILQLAFRLTGQTLAVARLTSLCLTLLGFAALGAVVGQLWGRWAGLVSAWVLLGLPEVPVRAHVVMNDLPAIAFVLVALGAALSFRRSGRRILMALSGAAYVGALLIHPLLIYMALPLAVVLFLPGLGGTGEPARRTGWFDLAVFLGVVAGVGLLVLAAFDRIAFFCWVVRYNYGAMDENVQLAALGINWDQIVGYLGQRWTLVWLAVTSTAVLYTMPAGRRGLTVAAAWLLATVVAFLMWSPVWKHYLLFLALPLVVVAGGGLATVGEWVVGERKRSCCLTWWRVTLAALMLVGAVVFLVDRCGESMPQPEGGSEWSPHRLAARAFLEAAVTPDGFVVTDDPLLAFATGRLVPPALTEASYKQIRSGYLTVEDLVVSVLRYRAQAVLFATGRLDLLPAFERWVAPVAAERRDFGPIRAYRLALPSSAPHTAVSYLGSGIELCGYALSSDELRPGDVLTVTLFWKRDGPVIEDYTIFVHLLDEENRMWGQHDGPPLMGAYPTSRWTGGLLLPDPHALVISPETPPGRYRLLVGMYRWPSLERLPAYRPGGERWLDDRTLLTEVHIIAPVRASNLSPPIVSLIAYQQP